MPEPRSESPSLRWSTLFIPETRTSITITCHVILHFEQQRLSAITIAQAVSVRLSTRRLPYRFISSHHYLCPPCPSPPLSSSTHLWSHLPLSCLCYPPCPTVPKPWWGYKDLKSSHPFPEGYFFCVKKTPDRNTYMKGPKIDDWVRLMIEQMALWVNRNANNVPPILPVNNRNDQDLWVWFIRAFRTVFTDMTWS